ncbi:MAG: ABC transporter substrate-binding protein [Rhodospirillaceae bacterium]|nr:ABC transporter substrate-binding protein [Rhodospirillaceae bacterium]
MNIYPVAIAFLLAASCAQAEELRIGFLNTTSGPGAVIGKHLEAGWKLGLVHQGWQKDGDKLGGAATRIFYADDQMKTDVAVNEVERLLKKDKVHLISGILWGNIMLSVGPTILKEKRILIANNAGPSPFAGEGCSPYFVSTAWSNEETHEATGELVENDKTSPIVLMVPNYQGGRDSLKGFKRAYKGKIADQIMFKLGQTDFQAELSKVRVMAPAALVVFAPGAMGISFVKQWKASGLDAKIKLYTIFVVDYSTLGAIGEAAAGSIMVSNWNPNSEDPRNTKFVKDYLAKFGRMPSAYAAQAYDAPGLIAAAVRKTKGNVDDTAALARAMRGAPMSSVRGDLKFNVNGFPIQPYYKQTVVRDAAGKLVISTLGKLSERRDNYWQLERRL